MSVLDDRQKIQVVVMFHVYKTNFLTFFPMKHLATVITIRFDPQTDKFTCEEHLKRLAVIEVASSIKTSPQDRKCGMS